MNKRNITGTILLCLALLVFGSLSFANGTGETAASSQAGTLESTWKAKGTPLADVRVRQALRYAIDMETIVDELFDGNAQKAIDLCPPGPWLSDDLETYDYDPEKAKDLLEEAGWPADYTLDIVYYYSDQQTVDLMSIIQQYWKAVGVKSSFRKLEGDLGSQLWSTPEDRANGPSEVVWDMAYVGISALTNNEFYDRFESTSPSNSYLPATEGLDDLIQATRATADIQKQQEAFHKLEKVFNQNMYVMPLYHQLSFIYVSDKLDTVGSPMGNDQFSYEKNILDWKTSRSGNMIYTNGGPVEFYQNTAGNPGLFLYQELLFDKLIDSDENLTPTDGMLAKAYTVSPDGLTITFDLRDDVVWHDDVPFAANDVKFTIEYYCKVPGANAVALNTFKSLKGAQEYIAGDADSIEGIKIDGNTVTLEFEKLDPNALTTFAQWPILPEHILAGSDPLTFQQNSFWQHPIGTGPFEVAETNLGNYCILSRNEAYYRKGSGNIQKIFMYASFENDENLLKNAEAGKMDYAFSKNVTDAKGIASLPGMKVYPQNIRYTRCFFINQYPHEEYLK
jgi:peptide/nickel transport system substrate-binding protein